MLPLLLGGQVVCLWIEQDSKRRLRQLARPGCYRLLGESSQECTFAEDAAGAGQCAAGWWALGPTCERYSRPPALESVIETLGSTTLPRQGQVLRVAGPGEGGDGKPGGTVFGRHRGAPG